MVKPALTRLNWVSVSDLNLKKLLYQRELNITPLSQEDEYKTQNPVERNFSFSIFFL